MKKNNVMRVFSLLLALTLISVCAISGTFAKYVTKAEGKDHARVAKWGVLLNVEGNAFSDKYEATDTKYLAAGGQYSVQAFAEEGKDADQVVAPGTNSEQVGTTLTASVTGKPEVAARYAIEVKDVKDIVLPAGKYTDYTVAPYEGKFTLDKAYSPVKWNLVITKGTATFNVATELYDKLETMAPALLNAAKDLGFSREGCSIFSAIEILKKIAPSDQYKNIIDGALGQIVTGGRNFQLDLTNTGLIMSYDFDPNKDMGFNFELTWEWAFEQEDVELYDKADTLLGNIAAGVAELPEGASININAEIVATATQID